MIRLQLSKLAVCTVVTTFALIVGCQDLAPPSPPTGGDSPVTVQRLTDSRLTDIREPLSWTFESSTVVIEYGGQPIPSDVANALLGDGPAPVRIEASWRLDEAAGVLRLTGLKTEELQIDKEVSIPIAPAGHVRLNLGSRQYNLFRDVAKGP